FGASVWILPKSVSSRPGSVPVTNLSASVSSPSHDHGHGSAHCVMMLEKPASLPPTVIVTMFVELLSAPSCSLVTLAVVAPEQALNVRLVPARSLATSSGYAYRLRLHVDSKNSRVPTPDEYESPSAT